MAAVAPKNSTNKKKVLIVDDDLDLLELLSDIFLGAGFKVVTATDGIDGTFKYNNETFDIILSDIKMPKKDGIKFVQYIQATEAQIQQKSGSVFKSTPILLISASAEDYKVEIELLKNIAVLNKPFGPKDVLDKVAGLLDKKIASSSTIGGTLLLKAGEWLFKEGSEGEDLYFVKEGNLRVIKKGSVGKEVTITEIEAGEMVGEIGLLLKKQRSASVVAVTDSVLISIPKEKLDAVLSGQPKWFKVLFETVTTRLEETTRLLAEEKSRS